MNTAQTEKGKPSSRALWMLLIALLLGGILVVIAAAEIGIRLLQARK